MKTVLIILVWTNLLLPTFAQKPVEFTPKALLAELQKVGIINTSGIKEILMDQTYAPQDAITGKYFIIENNNTGPYNFIYIGRVNSCRAGGCSTAPDLTNHANSEYFDYFILFDKQKTVQAVKVFNYQASHGQEITAKGWLKQFVGYNGTESLQVSKNIDAISGATISVYAITFDVMTKTELLQSVKL